jgi:hypothetical protein
LVARYNIGIVEVTFAGGAPHHECAHPHESRPYPTDTINQSPYFGTGANKEILVKNKKRLDGANAPICILDNEIPIIKSLQDRIFDNLVVAMVLSLIFKRTRPTSTMHQLITQNNLNAPWGRNYGILVLLPG